MRQILVVCLILQTVTLANGQQRWDTLRNEHHCRYLADINIWTIGNWILKDSIPPSDNYVTFRCMDSILSKNRTTRDHFFPVFTVIVDKADGALAEVVGEYALGYARRYPKELAGRYKCCPGVAKCCGEFKRFSSYAGNEIMMSDDNQKEYNELLGQMARNYNDWKKNKVLVRFIEIIDEVRRTW